MSMFERGPIALDAQLRLKRDALKSLQRARNGKICSVDCALGTTGSICFWVDVLLVLSSMTKPHPTLRSDYRAWRNISTRWMDNDAYGHVNNVVYYSWFDTAVNAYLIEAGALDLARSATIGLVVETHCNYFEPLTFPQTVDVGLRVAHRGTSSVRYELGIFGAGDSAAAQGHFIHVYVDALTRKPVPLAPTLVSVLDVLL